MTYGDDDEWYTIFEVITAAEQGARVELTVPVDDPVTVYRWVWDGRRILEAGDEVDDLSYTLYEAPEEEEGLLDFVNGWVLDPEGAMFAAECAHAEPIDKTKEIAGRPARGFRCKSDTGQEALWIDVETYLVLSWSGIDGEGEEPGILEAERVTLDVPIDDRTFSTEPPKGADVEVVKSTGITPPPPETSKSAAELEVLLRDIAATTDSPIPIYYVGRDFDGEPLSDVVIYNKASGGEAEGDVSLDPGQGLWIMYGDRLSIEASRHRPGDYRGAVGCWRKPDLRGVPTVQWSDAIILFTQDAVIRLGDTADRPKAASEAARTVREAGEDQPTGADLLPPPEDLVADVDQACGEEPGGHGPLPED